MTWADFYLICFVAGFAFSFLAFLSGGLRWHLHLPHFPHVHGTVPAPHAGHAAGWRGHVSPFNFVSLAAFLAWFGGTGYLLTRFSSLWFIFGLGLAMLSGLAASTIVFMFLARVLTSEEENLDPADFEMCGVLGRISVSIRAGGTGELIYSQAGTRRTCGARAEDGAPVSKGTEVVVTRYEKGIAYVRLWSEMSGEMAEGAQAGAQEPPQKGSAQ